MRIEKTEIYEEKAVLVGLITPEQPEESPERVTLEVY